MIKGIINSLLIKAKENAFVLFVNLLIWIVILVPLPALLLDIFILLNFIHALMFMFIGIYSVNIMNSTLFPMSLLIHTIFNLALNISITRLILTRGSEFNDWLIRGLSLLFDDLEKGRIIIGLIILILIIVLNKIMINKSCSHISKTAECFTINKEDSLAKNEEEQKGKIFIETLNGTSKFVSGYENIRILIITLNFLYVILSSIFNNDESTKDMINIYFPVIISSGILCIIPTFLISLTMKVVIKKIN